MMTKDQFVHCYLTAVLFGEHCSNGGDDDENWEYLDSVYTIDDFSPEAFERAAADCEAFLQAAENADIPLLYADCAEQAAYDFYFTSRGHGTGFWDKPKVYGTQEAEILTKIAESFCFPEYYDADGKIYCL